MAHQGWIEAQKAKANEQEMMKHMSEEEREEYLKWRDEETKKLIMAGVKVAIRTIRILVDGDPRDVTFEYSSE